MVRSNAVLILLHLRCTVSRFTCMKRLKQWTSSLVLFVQNGRLAAGDQLLSADGQSLVGLSQER